MKRSRPVGGFRPPALLGENSATKDFKPVALTKFQPPGSKDDQTIRTEVFAKKSAPAADDNPVGRKGGFKPVGVTKFVPPASSQEDNRPRPGVGLTAETATSEPETDDEDGMSEIIPGVHISQKVLSQAEGQGCPKKAEENPLKDVSQKFLNQAEEDGSCKKIDDFEETPMEDFSQDLFSQDEDASPQKSGEKLLKDIGKTVPRQMDEVVGTSNKDKEKVLTDKEDKNSKAQDDTLDATSSSVEDTIEKVISQAVKQRSPKKSKDKPRKNKEQGSLEKVKDKRLKNNNKEGFGQVAEKKKTEKKVQKKPKDSTNNGELAKRGRPSKATVKDQMLELREIRTDGTWVECTSCKKWRHLADVRDPSQVPEVWQCPMNTSDPDRNTCDAPEEDMHEYAKSVRSGVVELDYGAGSVVWAKMAGWPWWPGLVDDDPDTLEFFWTNEGEDVASWYHVVFFDRGSVSRAWIRKEDMKSYKRGKPSFSKGVPVAASLLKRRLDAVKEAERALDMELTERKQNFCFVSKFTGKWGEKFDWAKVGEQEEEPSAPKKKKKKLGEDDTAAAVIESGDVVAKSSDDS